MNKSEGAYKTIGEVVKILKLKANRKGILPTHTIRFWEKQFKQIKPKKINSNTRYYDQKSIDILKKIKFLLKDQGMTIRGVKNIIKDGRFNLDDEINLPINTPKNDLKLRLKKISSILNNLKENN